MSSEDCASQPERLPRNPGNHMTELDIAKIVAQKYAKAAPPDERTHFSSLVREEFRSVYKVWSAFVKFLRSQISGRQKIIDTTLIGYLYKSDDEPVNPSNVQLLPSSEFFEAGKFKNKLPPVFTQHEDLYKQMKESGKLVTLNHATVALVCGVSKTLVHKVLTDFWSAFIEVSRRTQQEILLDFKFGHLHLYRNGELFFESKSETVDPSSYSWKRNSEPREDISVIDSASAILSASNGRAMSIKSSYLENLSVRTPQTHISKASSIASSRSTSQKAAPQNWMKYRMRQKYTSTTRDSKEDAPSPLEEEMQKKQVPYPFLSAFIERRTGQRFTKRVKFDPSQTDNEKFLQHIIGQINTKKEVSDAQREVKRVQDEEFLNNLRNKIIVDQQQVLEDKRQKQLDFIRANEALKQQKHYKDVTDSVEKKNYKLSYFPFTHGDSILHQRKMWKEMQQADLAELVEKDQVSPIKRKPLNTLNDGELFTIYQQTSPYNSSQSPLVTVSEFVSPGSTPQETFLQPSYPYPVKNNESMARAQDGAWKRFEQQLKRDEDVKRQQAQFFHQAVTRDQQAIEGEITRKQVLMEENKRELDVQIKQKEDISSLEKELSKQFERTSFGPEEDHLLYEILGNRRAEARLETQQQLLQMIKERADRKEFMDGLEKSLDATVIDQTVQAFHEEQRERKTLEKERMHEMRNAWIEQAFVNEKARHVENLFN